MTASTPLGHLASVELPDDDQCRDLMAQLKRRIVLVTDPLAKPCCDPLADEPIEVTVSESCDELDREVEQAQQAVTLAASVLTNPTPETQEAWAELRDSCGVVPEFVMISTDDGTCRVLTNAEREQLFGYG